MEHTPTILDGYSDREKGAYLAAIASLSSADRSASEEELQYLDALAESANISEEQKAMVRSAAQSVSGEDLQASLEVLKGSELRFSLLSDMIAFASADGDYNAEEKANIDRMAQYLGVNQQQVSLLDQFTKKAVQEAPSPADENADPNFLSGLGFGDKMKSAGINTNALFKGALGVLGPILLAQMFRRRGGGGMMPGGGGGLLGGLLGGGRSGGMMGGGMLGGGGGGMLGGLLGGGLLGGLLGGGRGFGSTGGLLGRVLGGGGRSPF